MSKCKCFPQCLWWSWPCNKLHNQFCILAQSVGHHSNNTHCYPCAWRRSLLFNHCNCVHLHTLFRHLIPAICLHVSLTPTRYLTPGLSHTYSPPPISLCLSPLLALLPLTHFTEVHPLKQKQLYPLCRLVAFIHVLAVWGGRTPQVMDGTTSRLSDRTLCSVWKWKLTGITRHKEISFQSEYFTVFINDTFKFVTAFFESVVSELHLYQTECVCVLQKRFLNLFFFVFFSKDI